MLYRTTVQYVKWVVKSGWRGEVRQRLNSNFITWPKDVQQCGFSMSTLTAHARNLGVDFVQDCQHLVLSGQDLIELILVFSSCGRVSIRCGLFVQMRTRHLGLSLI